jgi:hypothetical protein
MNFFLTSLLCSLLFAAFSHGSVFDKRIVKEEDQVSAPPPIQVENADGFLEKSGPILESICVKSNSPKWTDLDILLKSANIGDENMNSRDGNTAQSNKPEEHQDPSNKCSPLCGLGIVLSVSYVLIIAFFFGSIIYMVANSIMKYA